MDYAPPLPNLRFIEKIGIGGMSTVWKALDETRNEIVAVKILNNELTKNKEDLALFKTEEKVMEQINHQGVVKSYQLSNHEGVWYYIMEYVDGYNFSALLGRKQHLQEGDCLLICESIAAALDYAWNEHGVVHCDIKPENIMIQPDGLVKLVDLGIAKSDDIKDSLNTTTESVFGTPAYVAPEQAIDAAKVDTRADIYSLGVVLFEMIAGRPPFEGPNAPQILAQTLSDDPFPDIRDFNPEVKPLLAVLIRRMCVKEKERRISDPTALLKEFDRLGYKLTRPASARVQYAQNVETAPTHRSVKSVLDRLPQDRKDTLSFETDDVEIQNFVGGLKRRKFVRKIAVAVFALLGVAVTAVSILLVAAKR